MGLYDNNLVYVALFIAVLILQALWLLLSFGNPREEASQKKEFLISAACCVCTALAAVTLLRLYPGNNRPPTEDSSVFLYIGKRMLEGKLPYRDLFDHKGPILYLIEVLGLCLSPQSTDGVWVLEVLNLLVTTALMLRIGIPEAENRASCYLAVLTAVGVCGWKVWRGVRSALDYPGGSCFFSVFPEWNLVPGQHFPAWLQLCGCLSPARQYDCGMGGVSPAGFNSFSPGKAFFGHRHVPGTLPAGSCRGFYPGFAVGGKGRFPGRYVGRLYSL